MVELTALLLFSNRGSKISCFHSTTNNGWNDILLHTTCQQFIKQEQWERWRAKRQLVSGSSTGSASAGSGGITPDIFWDCIRKILQYIEHFRSKMVCNVAQNAFLNTLTVRTPFPCVPIAFQQSKRRSHAFHLEMTTVTCTWWSEYYLSVFIPPK